jgi:hypothetical protein
MASISGAFRGIPHFTSTQNLADGQVLDGTEQRTQGATAIDQLPLQPSLAAPWLIAGWSIAFDLWLFQAVSAPVFGRLGTIIGGLCHPPQTVEVGTGRHPVQPLPANISLLTQLWDGNADTSPPSVIAGATSFPGAPTSLQTTYPLPQPLVLEPGDQLAIGLWLTPSVSQNVQLCVFNAKWTVSYDEQPIGSHPWGEP